MNALIECSIHVRHLQLKVCSYATKAFLFVKDKTGNRSAKRHICDVTALQVFPLVRDSEMLSAQTGFHGVFTLRLLEALPVCNFCSGHLLIILAERCKQVLNRGRR